MKCAKCKTNEARMHPIFGPTWCKDCTDSTPPMGISNYKLRTSGSIEYHDGGKKRTISKAMLKQIKSGVQTHEGEMLYGKSAQQYMDKYSRKYLGKDLRESYKSEKI